MGVARWYYSVNNVLLESKNMPSTCCCVPGCSKRGGHQFPSDPSTRKSWIIAIGRRSGEDRNRYWEPTDASVVCQSHFLPSDYVSTTMTGVHMSCISYNFTRVVKTAHSFYDETSHTAAVRLAWKLATRRPCA